MVGLFKSNVYRPSGADLLKVEFLIRLKGVNFCGVLFCGCFFLRELIFADRGQSAKSAKIRTRKIFMLHGTNQLGMSDLMTKKIKAGRRSSTVMASAESVK